MSNLQATNISGKASEKHQWTDERETSMKYGRGGAPGLATYLRIGSNLEIL